MGKKKIRERAVVFSLLCVMLVLMAGIIFVLWENVLRMEIRLLLLCLTGGILAVAVLWMVYVKREVGDFADRVCETLDSLIAGKEELNFRPYEESPEARVNGKLMQLYDILQEGRRKSQQDRQDFQEIISDISHQVKTPIANIKMFHEILSGHQLLPDKKSEFIELMGMQISKIDFLMQSLVKMSRLEAGTFALHMKDANLYDTIAQALSSVWAKAEHKNITIDVECDSDVMVKHDSKWTAEAFMNLLDNAVKYTPANGNIMVQVKPWQFYTRIDIIDSGIGISKEHYHDVFKRFYRAPEVAAEEGVGLGLYLARGIITRQKGYISVKSETGGGTTFSVYLPS